MYNRAVRREDMSTLTVFSSIAYSYHKNHHMFPQSQLGTRRPEMCFTKIPIFRSQMDEFDISPPKKTLSSCQAAKAKKKLSSIMSSDSGHPWELETSRLLWSRRMEEAVVGPNCNRVKTNRCSISKFAERSLWTCRIGRNL